MITTPLTTELMRGAAEVESTDRGVRPHRLPLWVREQFPNQSLMAAESEPSGVRLEFRTAATVVELVVHPSRVGYRGAERARGRCDLYIDEQFVTSDALAGGDLLEVDVQSWQSTHLPGKSHTVRFTDPPDGDKAVQTWLPHNESVELVALKTDRPVASVEHHRPLWLHHGSSISQGSNTDRPSNIWPAVAARAAGVELNNLDTIRDGHPSTPLVVISPILCPIHEDTPGPGSVDPESVGTDQVRFIATGSPDNGPPRLTLRAIREQLTDIVAGRHDPHLSYLDGTALYGEQDFAELPLPDALHPDTATHRRIGERFAAHAFSAGGPFGQVR